MLKIAAIGAFIIVLLLVAFSQEVYEVQAEIPPLDKETNENYELATFALG